MSVSQIISVVFSDLMDSFTAITYTITSAHTRSSHTHHGLRVSKTFTNNSLLSWCSTAFGSEAGGVGGGGGGGGGVGMGG